MRSAVRLLKRALVAEGMGRYRDALAICTTAIPLAEDESPSRNEIFTVFSLSCCSFLLTYFFLVRDSTNFLVCLQNRIFQIFFDPRHNTGERNNDQERSLLSLLPFGISSPCSCSSNRVCSTHHVIAVQHGSGRTGFDE